MEKPKKRLELTPLDRVRVLEQSVMSGMLPLANILFLKIGLELDDLNVVVSGCLVDVGKLSRVIHPCI
jgi:hypothetical protein